MADGPEARTHLKTYIWLAVIVALAFSLRSVFNVESGFDDETQRHLFTGNDPYYHHRTVTHVLEEGHQLTFDPAINYPEGNWNPNPPLWTWLTAPVAVALDAMGVVDPVGAALNVMVAVWGALCAIPVYMMGRDLWGRRAGLWAAFFLAISAPHIQRTVWGYADHDAISMFFILLGAAFMVRGFVRMDARIHVEHWMSSESRRTGLRSIWSANRNTLVYAALAGVSLTAVAVTWKGYPYALAFLALGCFVQLVVDHVRGRDSTTAWLAYLIATAIATLLPWALYYGPIPQHFSSTVLPSLYVLGGVAVVGLVLVPTRNLPSILVFPIVVAGAALAFFALVYYKPDVANTIFSGLGYFRQSKLYSTIGEAQRPVLGDVAAHLGFFSFLIAFWGFGHVLRRAWKGHAAFAFVAALALVSMYLMFAASRFIVNASPVFALFMGYVMLRLLTLARTSDVRKRFRAGHGQGAVGRTFRSLSLRASLMVGVIGLLLILPNVWIGADAGMGRGFEEKHGLFDPTGQSTNHFGAFATQQELAEGNEQRGWLEAMQWLSQQDLVDATGRPLELHEKPAFIAWWDYGHWATGIGHHPSVADPFQSHYELSGRFLASDSEEEAMQWLSALLLTGNWQGNQGKYTPAVQTLIDDKYPQLRNFTAGYWYDPQIEVIRKVADPVALYDDLVVATGKRVQYFGVDERMGPFLTPQAPSGNPGIIYAPVFLANKNPDEYVEARLDTDKGSFVERRYMSDPKNGSYETPRRYFDQSNNEYELYNGRLFPLGRTPLQGALATDGASITANAVYYPTSKYANTMFARAFGGIGAELAPAGEGLKHWRVVFEYRGEDVTLSNGRTTPKRETALLEYYKGVTVSGVVLDDAGQPMRNVMVGVRDRFNATHGTANTDANGTFEVSAPFAVDGDLRLVALDGNTVLASNNSTQIQFTREQANRGGVRAGPFELRVQRGSIAGTAYVDDNHDGKYDAQNDTELAGVAVSIPTGQTTTTDAGGNYTVAGLQPGRITVTGSLFGYDNGTAASVLVPPGGVGRGEITMRVKLVSVNATFVGTDDKPVPGIQVQFKGPTTQNVPTNQHGAALATLLPGEYDIVVDMNKTETDGSDPVSYTASAHLTVPLGSGPIKIQLKDSE